MVRLNVKRKTISRAGRLLYHISLQVGMEEVLTDVRISPRDHIFLSSGFEIRIHNILSLHEVSSGLYMMMIAINSERPFE
jgi:hypothetical protein